MDTAGQRLDLWLWYARFFKTRSLATAQVSKGRMRITRSGETRRISKPAALIRPGDALTLSKNGRIVRIRIEALGERRGPATEAQTLYTPIEDEAGPKASPPSPGPSSGD